MIEFDIWSVYNDTDRMDFRRDGKDEGIRSKIDSKRNFPRCFKHTDDTRSVLYSYPCADVFQAAG